MATPGRTQKQIAERYKGRFGNGPMTLAEFEKLRPQLCPA